MYTTVFSLNTQGNRQDLSVEYPKPNLQPSSRQKQSKHGRPARWVDFWAVPFLTERSQTNKPYLKWPHRIFIHETWIEISFEPWVYLSATKVTQSCQVECNKVTPIKLWHNTILKMSTQVPIIFVILCCRYAQRFSCTSLLLRTLRNLKHVMNHHSFIYLHTVRLLILWQLQAGCDAAGKQNITKSEVSDLRLWQERPGNINWVFVGTKRGLVLSCVIYGHLSRLQ